MFPSKMEIERRTKVSLPLSRVVVPLPAARLPISPEVFARGYGQLHGYGALAALASPLVIVADGLWFCRLS